ncbi:hypothetical protein [Clostridium estertheticum]|uniref:Uncharacterized protein n=1 Tax=Clostridium estertheticum TaxID=238834 RepID=A0AA47EN05_9CLOT|nr:hypothetical protein [Clostridium estertheticum]MBU3157610.1 hypothetical protein [Clostridium estertheticum]MBU3171685.1 hypothetical protein [Clostridium estertheticum]MBZ9618376.1 hypothetical protein [Clostridium estertheticum subsp. laramiense]WAG63227.1 hypothetical protein LL038_25140 [Clostridium estertheticum]WAG76383.1 hypothetical protein LL032_23355 [Clostridium estertheticum]
MHIKEMKEVINGIEQVNNNVDSVRINTNDSNEKLDKIISLLEKLVKQGE